MVDFKRPELTELKPRIAVIGVGGAGGNAVTNMIVSGLQGVDFVVANTDAQSLAVSEAETRIQLGLKITQGLGAGSRPEIGRAAAEETIEQIEAALDGCHMCFITAGMGGGTGTGAAPVVARAAREKGILTVGVVTKPFAFEGLKRMRSAEEGIVELQKHVDTLIIIPNQNLFLIANANTTFKDAFAMADQVLHQGVRGITDLMIMPGLINLDFADIRTVMSEMGKAMMGTGEASGENRAIEAAEKAIANPLLDEVSMRGAKGVIINITGGDDLRLMEVDEAATHIREMVDPEANIIVGSAFNPDLNGVMRVSVVATGIDVVARTPAVSTTRTMPAFGGTASAFPTAAAPRTPAPEPTVSASAHAVTEPEPEPLDLSLDDVVDEPAEPMIRFTPAPPQPAAPVVAATPAALTPMRPQPEVEEKPLTLFEKMMNLSRKPAARPAVTTLAPDPEGEPDPQPEVAIPSFFKKQANN
ncbi:MULTISPECIES: cell division protein FtsZ [Sphingosinicellaceae]|uniref:cell division protein FtsZ n=1 Tax=Sphingosinicellaceae TaxID=2820280 RepID=UPI001C1E0F9F|nr:MULTISPECIES: cell division protein FtsZ [Polymorphobacter]QYE35084.1 cell division protein FtsZ [Polymorphobacter sp. PAMC 29334]UAJ11568.1 cell division protein FtsZ [Polymorphobacter megasporae]